MKCAGYLGHPFRQIEHEQISTRWIDRQIPGQPGRKMKLSHLPRRENREGKTKIHRYLETVIAVWLVSFTHPWEIQPPQFLLRFESHGATLWWLLMISAAKLASESTLPGFLLLADSPKGE
jgi:hypothetical protein